VRKTDAGSELAKKSALLFNHWLIEPSPRSANSGVATLATIDPA
jgi:hypothetical protein